jgi:hypothetical protein
MKLEVYNLELRSWCREMTIFGYRFARVVEYEERLQSLQHHVTAYSEFNIRRNTGEHAVTAYVEVPEPQQTAVIGLSGKVATALNDILLLISLFTGRDVFALANSKEEDADRVIIADPRVYCWGNALQCSIPYKAGATSDALHPPDIGLEEGLNQIYERVREDDWRRKYQDGHFLFLANHAFRQYDLAAAFTQCWTIWEHLFAVLNRAWMSEKQLRRINAAEKVAFLLVQYGFTEEIAGTDAKAIEGLVRARNWLVHDGRFPEDKSVHDHAVLFVRLTEFIVAKTLGLLPSNVFDTMDKFKAFLNKQQHPTTLTQASSSSEPK